MRKTTKLASLLLAASLPSCGILTAPLSFPKAVAENATYHFNGRIIDETGKPLDGVVCIVSNNHYLWAPLSGHKEVSEPVTRRVDGKFDFVTRGSSCDFTFSKDGYFDASFRFNADHPDLVTTGTGTWHNMEGFSVVLAHSRTPTAQLIHTQHTITYIDYPNSDAISLINLATSGSTGDAIFKGKDAEDPTIFPLGTLYATLDKEPPQALNAKGDIDVAELDIPHHVTLHLPGKDAGFIPIKPQTGMVPMLTTDTAPDAGYQHELTFTRARLKAMRSANNDNIIEAYEYFFFHAGPYFGKATFSWAIRGGKPVFLYDLYLQPEPNNRDLSLHAIK